MLQVSLRHSFAGFDLDVSFDAPPGITVLFGRSGSGKTTIINAVAGLLRPDGGHITVAGTVLCDTATGLWLPPHKRRLGYVFQEARLFPHMTVRQNLGYGRWFAPKTGQREDMRRIVEMLGIGPLLDRRPAMLSGGEKQRVAIGRALLASPQLILADEPLAALDDTRKSEILPYFERLRDEVSVPILYVSHSASEVSRLATTIVTLEKGRIARQGPAAEVLSDPDATPMGPREAGSMLQARLIRHHSDGLSELDADGVTLVVPKVAFAPGAALRVRIEAQDVMLALEKPHGISALNVLPATVAAVRIGDGPGALVQLRVGGNLILSRVTRRSALALGLKPGTSLFAVIKAVSVPRDAIGDRRDPSA
jgi:molybdate transport system ATP-binding protein